MTSSFFIVSIGLDPELLQLRGKHKEVNVLAFIYCAVHSSFYHLYTYTVYIEAVSQ